MKIETIKIRTIKATKILKLLGVNIKKEELSYIDNMNLDGLVTIKTKVIQNEIK